MANSLRSQHCGGSYSAHPFRGLGSRQSVTLNQDRHRHQSRNRLELTQFYKLIQILYRRPLELLLLHISWSDMYLKAVDHLLFLRVLVKLIRYQQEVKSGRLFRTGES